MYLGHEALESVLGTCTLEFRNGSRREPGFWHLSSITAIRRSYRDEPQRVADFCLAIGSYEKEFDTVVHPTHNLS